MTAPGKNTALLPTDWQLMIVKTYWKRIKFLNFSVECKKKKINSELDPSTNKSECSFVSFADDASSCVIFAAVRTETSGRWASASSTWGRVSAGLPRSGPELLSLVLLSHCLWPCHHHWHFPTLDPWPHQPNDPSTAGTDWNILAKCWWPRRFAAQMAGGRHAGIRWKDCWACQGQEGHVLPGCIQGWSRGSKSKLFSGIHTRQINLKY